MCRSCLLLLSTLLIPIKIADHICYCAHRLESLGALTQGDRAATVGAKNMSITDFNFDTKYGKKVSRSGGGWLCGCVVWRAYLLFRFLFSCCV